MDGFLDIGYPEIIMILAVIPLAFAPELLEYARKLGNTIRNFRI